MAPQVDEQDIIAQAAIDFHIRQAHGPILVEAVDEDDRLMGIMTVLDIRPAQDRPVLTIDPDRFPAPFLFPLADGGHVSAVVLDAQELVPGSIIKFFISHISDISPDTAQDDGQADQEQEQAFQEALHHDTLQLPVPAGFYFILHGSQRRTASRFNGGDDGTFDEGAVQELYLPVVQAFSDHFCRHDGTAHIHDAGDAIALIYGFDSRRDFLETRSQAAVFESAGSGNRRIRRHHAGQFNGPFSGLLAVGNQYDSYHLFLHS